MKKLSVLLFVMFSICFAQSSIACSCNELPNSFCGTINSNSNVGKITVVEEIEFFHQDRTYSLVKVVFDELLQGTAPEVDTFYLLDGESSLCELSITRFSVEDELVINYNHFPGYWAQEAEEVLGTLVLTLSGCGRQFLRVRGDRVEGDIKHQFSSQSYADFRANIGECAATFDNAAAPNELEAVARFTEGLLFIRINRSVEATVSLHNAAGQLIRSKKGHFDSRGNSLRLSVPFLPSGVYFLSIETASGRSVVPVLRN